MDSTYREFRADQLTELPTSLPGRIFRSPMPFGRGDPDGRLFAQYIQQNISVIVLLASDQECIQKSGRDLRLFYTHAGQEVIYLPIPDFGVPEPPALETAICQAMGRLRAGANVLVHCYAGIGRTGTFLACLAKRGLGLNTRQAIEWVRLSVPGALETAEQIQLVSDF